MSTRYAPFPACETYSLKADAGASEKVRHGFSLTLQINVPAAAYCPPQCGAIDRGGKLG